jgi:hypothetical protein
MDYSKTLTLLSILKKKGFPRKFYSASGCGSSDVCVRSESESLPLLPLSIEDSPLLLSLANSNSQQVYVFAINNKAYLPSVVSYYKVLPQNVASVV